MIYVAAPWIYKDEARTVISQFRTAGVKVSSSWADFAGDSVDPEVLINEARRDWDEVREADALVLLNWEKSEGKSVETGLALAYGLPIIAVGKPSNVFHYLKNHFIWVDSVEQAIIEVKRVLYKT